MSGILRVCFFLSSEKILQMDPHESLQPLCKKGTVTINLLELFETQIIECEEHKINFTSSFLTS